MNQPLPELPTQYTALSAEEKIALAEALLASVPLIGTKWEHDWRIEATDRLAAYERGELTATDAEQVLTGLRGRSLQP